MLYEILQTVKIIICIYVLVDINKVNSYFNLNNHISSNYNVLLNLVKNMLFVFLILSFVYFHIIFYNKVKINFLVKIIHEISDILMLLLITNFLVFNINVFNLVMISKDNYQFKILYNNGSEIITSNLSYMVTKINNYFISLLSKNEVDILKLFNFLFSIKIGCIFYVRQNNFDKFY
jgi:hypothetical protein